MKSLVRIFVLVFMLALMQPGAMADLPEPKTPVENPNVVAGRKAIEEKNFTAALRHLTKAVQEEPDNADAHSMLGYSHRKLGTFDKSMEHYRKALAVDADHLSAHEYLGELYLDMKQLPDAEKQLAALKKACPFFGKCEEFEDLKKAIDAYKARNK